MELDETRPDGTPAADAAGAAAGAAAGGGPRLLRFACAVGEALDRVGEASAVFMSPEELRATLVELESVTSRV
ncbi:MAG TPA: hypothetical protein VFM50_09095, partial [Nocardioidaceae bacterium]|nr:hypothetical protein [Nocardioidaceae bacterium]